MTVKKKAKIGVQTESDGRWTRRAEGQGLPRVFNLDIRLPHPVSRTVALILTVELLLPRNKHGGQP